MDRFLNANDEDYIFLGERSQNNCLVFADQRMPPGSTPALARVGVERHAAPQRILLLVERGVQYPGSDPSIRSWLTSGVKEFSDIRNLREWVRGPLARAFQTAGPEPIPAPSTTTAITNRRSAHELTNLPAVAVPKPRRRDADEIFTVLAGRVRGQDAALRAMSSAVAGHLGKSAPRRPSSLFMVGPTGVGKTLAVETLAEFLAQEDNSRRYLRLDMAEYQEPHRVAQLFGAPPGYVGYNDGAVLTGILRTHPGSVVLFDEIEKAHPSIFLSLMNALDAGRLSSPTGVDGRHQIDCRSAVFCFTSNLRSGAILDVLKQQKLAVDTPEADDCIRKELSGAQLPRELIGRISRCIAFLPLNDDARLEAIILAIRDLVAEYGLNLHRIDPAAVAALASRTEATFGARSQLHALERALSSALAEAATHHAAQTVELYGPPFRLIPFCEPRAVRAL
jgi:ATP-dependent Clp protease ATP-binding subunit ClpA